MDTLPVVAKERPKASPKDVFLHLLGIITLYASAGSLISLFFAYINLGMPDALEGLRTYQAESARNAIRFSISALIVVFPAYLFTMRYLGKQYVRETWKRELRIRKWLVYFTLFVAALILIGDVVSLVYNFLGGELTTRFVLKVFSVFCVVGAIFVYYFWDVKANTTE
ncbi:MAG: DUF5671 domain-containing protein [Patescibacteria group bacterium]